MDIMSIGDDGHLIELILADPKLSDSMRNVIEIFNGLMTDVIRKVPVNNMERYTVIQNVVK